MCMLKQRAEISWASWGTYRGCSGIVEDQLETSILFYRVYRGYLGMRAVGSSRSKSS